MQFIKQENLDIETYRCVFVRQDLPLILANQFILLNELCGKQAHAWYQAFLDLDLCCPGSFFKTFQSLLFGGPFRYINKQTSIANVNFFLVNNVSSLNTCAYMCPMHQPTLAQLLGLDLSRCHHLGAIMKKSNIEFRKWISFRDQENDSFYRLEWKQKKHNKNTKINLQSVVPSSPCWAN